MWPKFGLGLFISTPLKINDLRTRQGALIDAAYRQTARIHAPFVHRTRA
jgi:hypothetical protein